MGVLVVLRPRVLAEVCFMSVEVDTKIVKYPVTRGLDTFLASVNALDVFVYALLCRETAYCSPFSGNGLFLNEGYSA